MNGALWQLTLVRLREFFREPGTLFWVFAFPILLALGLGLAFKSGVKPKAPVVVVAGPHAEQRARILENEGSFLVRIAPEQEAQGRLRSGKAILAVGGGEPVTFVFDPTHPDTEALRAKADDVLQRAAGRADVLATEDVKITQQGSRYIDFLIPGLLGMNIMGSSMWGIGWVIVQNRTRKLLKRLVATPMRRRDYLLSHIIARLAFLAMEVAVMIGFGYWMFGVAVLGSWVALTLLSFIGAMSFAGIGLLVASRAKTAETVSGLMNAVMLPMWLLSGVFFSAQNFPQWMQPIIQALPLTALNDGLRAVMNEGAGLLAVIGPLAILAAWGVLSFAVALKLFRWQ